MSVQLITAAIALPPILTLRPDGSDGGPSPSTKFLAVILANYADEAGRCWPKQETLARDTSLSLRGVRDGLALLEARGLIRREARFRDDGTRRGDVTYLLFGQPATVAGGYAGEAPEPLDDVSTGNRCLSINRQPLPHQPATVAAQEPSLEPSVVLSLERVREAAGEALASMDTHPGIASLLPLRAAMGGEKPCAVDDILAGIEQAAAWHMSRGGAGSMTTWTLAVRMAAQNRDQRLAGAPPKGRTDHGRSEPTNLDALSYGAARAVARLRAARAGEGAGDARRPGLARLPGRD